MKRIIIVGKAAEATVEDSGAFRQIRLEDSATVEGADEAFYVTLCSYDEEKQHSTLRTLEEKRLRITVEVES